MVKSSKEFIFVVKKTNELSTDEIKQINKLFNETLNKVRNEIEFKEKFLNNFLKFSFHGLMKLDNQILGCYHVIPNEFDFFSKKKLFGQSVDTTIHQDFRGSIYNLKKIANMVYSELQKFKIFFVYGLANEKFYLVKKKILGWKDIGKLNYYIYPNDLKKFFNKFYPLNFLLGLFLKLLIKIKVKLNIEYKFSISKIYNDNLNMNSYSGNKDYKIFFNKNYKLIYKIVNNKKYNNAKIIYIIDVLPLTQKNLERSINELLKSNGNVDLIIYIGKLSATPNNLFRIPDFFLKKQTKVSGKILDSTQIQETVFNISNWNINLSNFDIK